MAPSDNHPVAVCYLAPHCAEQKQVAGQSRYRTLMVFGQNDVAGRAADRREIGMNRIFKLFCVSVAIASTLTTAAMAQWSIGQPGSREPPPGLNRYVYMVMSDPLPAREFDFNDGYQNMHMGDLVQLPGWTGAQR